jgi:hypothetical protein
MTSGFALDHRRERCPEGEQVHRGAARVGVHEHGEPGRALEDVVEHHQLVPAVHEVGDDAAAVAIAEAGGDLAVAPTNDEMPQRVAVDAGAVAHQAGKQPADRRLSHSRGPVEDDDARPGHDHAR